MQQAITLPQFVLSRERQHLLHAKGQSQYYESQKSLILFSPRNVQERVLHGILVVAFSKYSFAIQSIPPFQSILPQLISTHDSNQLESSLCTLVTVHD